MQVRERIARGPCSPIHTIFSPNQLRTCCSTGSVQFLSPAQIHVQCSSVTVAFPARSSPPRCPVHAWFTAIASGFAMMSHTLSSVAVSRKSTDSVSGDDETDQKLKCARASATVSTGGSGAAASASYAGDPGASMTVSPK